MSEQKEVWVKATIRESDQWMTVHPDVTKPVIDLSTVDYGKLDVPYVVTPVDAINYTKVRKLSTDQLKNVVICILDELQQRGEFDE